MVVKTYRGLLKDGAQDKIPLKTKDGSVGYRIVKFQIIPNTPGYNIDSVVKISKVTGTPTSTIDFTDSDLLASGWIYNGTYETDMVIIFDNEIFNQDIFVQHVESAATGSINYYIELEQIKLDHTQNMSATLKAIRGAAVD
jgi:hypothetical protein